MIYVYVSLTVENGFLWGMMTEIFCSGRVDRFHAIETALPNLSVLWTSFRFPDCIFVFPIICLVSSCHHSFEETWRQTSLFDYFLWLYLFVFGFLIVLGIVRNKLVKENEQMNSVLLRMVSADFYWCKKLVPQTLRIERMKESMQFKDWEL